MTKEELSKILHSVGVPVNEGITDTKNEKTYPRIDYFEIAWEDVMSSGEEYTEQDTYQISLYARKMRCKELLLLRKLLRGNGLHPIIYHEFNQEERLWHSYMSVEVIVEETEHE